MSAPPPPVSAVPPRLQAMRDEAKSQPAFQVAYFCFEASPIYGPYAFADHSHSEAKMVPDLVARYDEYLRSKGKEPFHIFVYTMNSPCGEYSFKTDKGWMNGQQCSTLLANLPKHKPVRGGHFLGYTLLWSGIATHCSGAQAETIRKASLTGLGEVAAGGWKIHQIP